METVSLFNPTCWECGRHMGEMTAAELQSMVRIDGSNGLCFDCEPAGADISPDLLLSRVEGDFIDIGGHGFVQEDGRMRYVGVYVGVVHECVRAPGLSSSTYLNRNQQDALMLRDGKELNACGECGGEGYLFSNGHTQQCGGCDGTGDNETAIVLPRWLIGGDGDNG